MADTRHDRKEYQGAKGKARRAFEQDGVIGETCAAFGRGLVWSDTTGKAGPLIIFPMIAGTLGMIITAAETKGLADHVADRITDTEMVEGLSSDLGYQAIRPAGSSAPVVLVRDGDAYRFYTTEHAARNDAGGRDLEWSFVESQSEVWNIIRKTVRDLEGVRDSLDDPSQDRVVDFPDFVYFDRVSELYTDLDNLRLIQRWSTPAVTTQDDRPVNLRTELDSAIEQWRAAASAVAAGQYGFATEGAGDAAQLSLTAEGLQEQPYDTWGSNMVTYGKYTYGTILGIGMLIGTGYAAQSLGSRRRRRSEKPAPR